jgi:hypothetical protein
MGICFYLIGVLVHEDAPIGDRQFWVTRPISWRSLLVSKALFALLVMTLPVLAAQVVTVMVNGLPITSALAALLTKQASLLALLAVAMAFAVVTRNLTQFLLAGLFALVGEWVLLGSIFSSAYENGEWGSAAWIRGASLAVMLLPGVIALFVLAYWRRSPVVPRCLVAGLMLLGSVFLCWDWWHAAWSFQTRLYGNAATAPPVSISFDAGAPRPQSGNWYYNSRDYVVGIKLPIQIQGIPDNMQLVGERQRSRVELPDGRSWDSGWRAVGGIGVINGVKHLVQGNGENFVSVNIDAPFYDAAVNLPVRMRTRFAFTILGKPDVVQLPAGGSPRRVSARCLCSMMPAPDAAVWCFSLEGDDVRQEVYWEAWEPPMRYAGIVVPSGMFQAFAVWRYRRDDVPNTPFNGGHGTMLTRRGVNHIEVTLEVSGIRLRYYEVGRARGGRRFLEGLRIER